MIFIDTALYAALAPILPDLKQQFGLGKAGAGLLAGAYPVGGVAGALPSGWLTARYGPRAALRGALCVMVVAGIVFALAHDIVVLDVARFAQGFGGTVTWTAGLAWIAQTAPLERRGELLGLVIGIGVFGSQFGPVVGSIADVLGRETVFLVTAGIGIPLLIAAHRTVVAPRIAGEAVVGPRVLARDRAFLVGLWLTLLPSLAFGTIEVLVPLRLDDLGVGALGIGAAFFAGAGVEAAVSPVVGRLTDRRGMVTVVRAAAIVSAAGLVLFPVPGNGLLLAALLVVTSVGLGAWWVPGGQLVSVAAERLGVDQGWAFAVNNLGWAGGVAIGAAGGGLLGARVGDALPYALVAALMVATGVTAMLRPALLKATGS